MAKVHGMDFNIPGTGKFHLSELVLDFNGTLALDGRLLPGVKPRLVKLSKRLNISVLTADTFGTARTALKSLPVIVRNIRTGTDKKRFVQARSGVVAIGNGRNDVEMIQEVLIGIAVIGPEGCSMELLKAANLVVGDVHVALDLLLKPKRLMATLRF
jgi:P-type E1-E2 ATPase